MYYALAEKIPTVAERLSVFIALGPVTKITHTSSKVLRFAMDFYDTLDDAASLFGIYELLGSNWLTDKTVALFCNNIP